jgi:hypothetical protein
MRSAKLRARQDEQRQTILVDDDQPGQCLVDQQPGRLHRIGVQVHDRERFGQFTGTHTGTLGRPHRLDHALVVTVEGSA